MESEQKMKKNSKKKIFLAVTSIAAISSISIVTPFLINPKPAPAFVYNYSNTFEGNKNKVDDFVTELKLDSSSLLNSLKVYGKTGLIGTDGETLTAQERSFITIEQCNANNLFEFNFPRSLKYSLSQKGINAKHEYTKSDYSNTSYPIVGIKFYAGSGSTYYETIFEYREMNLYGFKKNNEQLFLDEIVNNIIANPKEYFQLKSTVGSIGQVGLYAKNITINDFDFNSRKLFELKQNNFFVSISSLKVDPFNPSNLKLFFDVTYNDGITSSYKIYNETSLNGFDIEDGVDDPQSIVKKFIKEEETYINNLNQYFVYNVNQDEEQEKISAEEAYKNNKITFEPSYSVTSKLNEDGIEISFKPYESNQTQLNVFNYEFDSTTPVYRLYVSSYVGTPYEYTEDVIIEGLEQQGDFKISSQEEEMNLFIEFLDDNNLNVEDIIEIDWSTFKLLGEFATFTNQQVPFYILSNAYNEYINDTSKFSQPFSFQVKLKQNLPNIEPSIQTIIEKIVKSMNDLATNHFEKLIETLEVNEQNFEMKLNITIGEYQKDLFVNLTPLIIDNFDGGNFISLNEYSLKQLETIKSFIELNPKKVLINLNETNGEITENVLADLLRKNEFESIFSSITLINYPNVVEFPQYDSEIQVEFNFDELKKLSKTEIEEIIAKREISIPLILRKENTTNVVITKIDKSFDEIISTNN